MVARQLREELEEIVHLDVILDAGDDLRDAEGSVAVVVAGLEVGAVAEFLGHGEGEDVAADGELAVDGGLGEAVVGDVEKAWDR